MMRNSFSNVQENRRNCMHCHVSVSTHTKHAFDFIASACIPQDRNVSYAIGNWHTHPSHHSVLYGGVLFCVRCGFTAMNKFEISNTPVQAL